MPSGTRSHAKAVPELRSLSAQFFSGFGAISARLLGAEIGQKGRKNRSGIWTGFRPEKGDHDQTKKVLPTIMCMARGGLLEGNKNTGEDLDKENPGKETRTGKDLEDPGRLIQHALLLG